MSASSVFLSKFSVIFRTSVRCMSKRSLGIPPEKALSLQEKMEKWSYKDPAIYYKVDIGFPVKGQCRKDEMKERSQYMKARKKDPNYIKLVMDKEVSVSAEEVNEEWLRKYSAYQMRNVAEHYGIFEHLYGDAYFYPQVILDIEFSHNSLKIPVHRGNVIKPIEATSAPSVTYEADSNSLWTLLLTNPDGHMTEENSEYVHWFIGNIPGNDIKKGEVVVDYLRPFPPKGTGYQRLIFVLYKQDKKIDFGPYKKNSTTLNLNDRAFSTYDFYRKHQDFITPAGLAFFQSDWDQSVTTFFHNELNCKEPIFEYDFPEEYRSPQKWFPRKAPFNLYMDKYRDPKQIAKEYFLRRMKKVHPFEPPKPALRFPNAVLPNLSVPSWLEREKMKERLKWGRMNDF